MRLKQKGVGILLFLCICLSIQAADFSITMGGTPRYCLMKDINRGINGYLDYWADLLQLSGGIITDNKRPLHLTMSYLVEFALTIDNAVSVGLGVGYIRARNRSDIIINYADERPETSSLVETTIDAIPIRLSVFRYYHLTRFLNAFVEGGIEVYNAKFRSSSWPAGPGDSHHQKAHSIGIGLLYGGGLEIRALKHLALVLEAEGNYARIGGFRGTRNSGGSNPPYEVNGELYFEDMTAIPPDYEKTYPFLVIYESKPTGGRVRPARVDLSGFSLSAGVKIIF